MKSLKRVLFAICFMLSIELFTLRVTEEFEWWVNVLLTMPILFYGLAIASRFWPYPGDKNDR